MSVTASRHNGRVGKDGLLLAKHNSRNFDLNHAPHIDPTRTPDNIFWDCYYGFRTYDEIKNGESFTDIEQRYYKEHYQNYINSQNIRNTVNRHPERNRTTEDLRKYKKTCPEESIYQIGDVDDNFSAGILMQVFSEYMVEFQKRYGANVHVLDWALHADEASPHIHERHVFDCLDEYGDLVLAETAALHKLEIGLPNADKPEGRFNNPKMMFDKICLELFRSVAKNNGIDVIEEVIGDGRKHQEKQSYIIIKQRKIMAEQQAVLDNLSSEIEQKQAELERLSISDELMKLKSLCDSGVLTEEEFNLQKQKLLQL